MMSCPHGSLPWDGVTGCSICARLATPVPASNVSEGLREAIDALPTHQNHLLGAMDQNLYLRRDDVLATLAHAAPERLDERLLVKAIEGGLASVDDEWTVGELAELSAAEYARLVRPELGASRDRPIIQPDATEEAGPRNDRASTFDRYAEPRDA